MGHLTPEDKKRMAEIYAIQKYNHLTFFKTVGKELQEQVELELLICDQLLGTDGMCGFPGESVLPIRARFITPKIALKQHGMNRTDLTSVFLTDEEKLAARESHQKFTKLKSSVIGAIQKYGKDATTSQRHVRDLVILPRTTIQPCRVH